MSGPASFEEARPGPHFVGHERGGCDLCDLYYKARPQVVRVRTRNGQASGIVVEVSGRIITNAHAVQDDDALEIETYVGDLAPGKTLRRSADVDLALVAVETSSAGWMPFAVKQTPLPAVGSDVYVIGHPVGLGWTVTRGIVSAVRRPGEVAPTSIIQTDAAISPGNSGGPLLDRQGRLIGVMVGKLAGPGIESVAFAIPASVVAEFLFGNEARPEPFSPKDEAPGVILTPTPLPERERVSRPAAKPPIEFP